MDNLFLDILQMKEYPLHNYLISLLRSYDYDVNHDKEYIYATIEEDNAAVCLIAHLDTVWMLPPETNNLVYDEEKDILISIDEGIGADDRAGVYIIVKLLELGYRPAGIVFTHNEEIGCIGAQELITEIPQPTKNFKYIIQVDRRGKDDCVFYDCDNLEFNKYLERFGWKKQNGTISDISIIAPAWGVAAVNVSAGYFNEHYENEYVKPKYILYNIIPRIEHMLADIDAAPSFSYIPKSKKTVKEPFNLDDSWFDKESTLLGEKNSCYYCGIRMINGVNIGNPFNNYYICLDCKNKHHPKL